MADKITILRETFENGETGQEVEGLTLMIDGKMKDVFDILISQNDDYNDYTEIMRDIVIAGVNHIIGK
ncbi:hypothetical protein ACH95_21240 [Bacillus glycinifermentans]|uniref:Uncharacterized protein n=1 Tax=Bacillus glycinifermentans TaxID=1664069 RepID=A0A0J6EG43_9BACI|nr:hypothetical protein [Bacillus glycinifermentans]ATH92918.1 hypothetical protein COP00_10150 [Bacillus glycinifermentans]KMM53700.1 hypothetical protein ACH95_21240 [Bacillus glycinifermentans]KRT94131.1 hypothetical protein AB447_202225 [Bacillus glycinifermentans]MEC0486391.1 hypothetical protein [Bacillus glycinifermentans]MEC0493303.1 hypothetical protein [Bacillus glycinifermentans]